MSLLDVITPQEEYRRRIWNDALDDYSRLTEWLDAMGHSNAERDHVYQAWKTARERLISLEHQLWPDQPSMFEDPTEQPDNGPPGKMSCNVPVFPFYWDEAPPITGLLTILERCDGAE